MSKDDVSWDVICNDDCGVLVEEWNILTAKRLARNHILIFNHEVIVTRSNNGENS